MRKTCLNEIHKLAKRDSRVVFVGSDIGAGTLEDFKKEMPDRFFMEGVSEAHLVGMMAGLAMEGKIPYMNTIATFMTRRCFEQILLDAGLHALPLRFVGSGGGGVYAPLGPTHCALEDIAILKTIPNMTIVAPCDADEMKRLMPQTLDVPGPVYVRLAKGGDRVVSRPDLPFVIGKGLSLKQGKDVLLVATGVTTQLALEAASQLDEEGLSTGVLHMPTLKPFDAEALLDHVSHSRTVISVEEHTVVGGLGSSVAETLAEAGFDQPRPFVRIGFTDRFADVYGSQASMMKHFGVTVENIVQKAHGLSRVCISHS